MVPLVYPAGRDFAATAIGLDALASLCQER
jgi:hypothetical protein